MTRFSRHLAFLLFAIAPAICSTACAQTFPVKPVRIVVGYPPGGGIDLVSRILAPKLAEALGQPVIVENKPGANGALAAEFVAKSLPDGYTIYIGTSGNLVINSLFYPNLPVSIERDFTPITQVASASFIIVSNPSFPVKTVAELVAYARAHPGKVNYSSGGNGSTGHLAGEYFRALAGIETVHIPYKGSAPSISDLIGGHVQYSIDATAIAMPHVKAGKLRALGTASPQRLEYLPDLPAIAETLPGYDVVNWYGMVVPTGTPRDIIVRLRNEIVKALSIPEVREKMIALGTEPVGGTGEELNKLMKAERAKWASVIKQSNIHPD